jgi:hypothetical protein
VQQLVFIISAGHQGQVSEVSLQVLRSSENLKLQDWHGVFSQSQEMRLSIRSRPQLFNHNPNQHQKLHRSIAPRLLPLLQQIVVQAFFMLRAPHIHCPLRFPFSTGFCLLFINSRGALHHCKSAVFRCFLLFKLHFFYQEDVISVVTRHGGSVTLNINQPGALCAVVVWLTFEAHVIYRAGVSHIICRTATYRSSCNR